ncbi:1-aminocyclopropane-1-carboxylate deaminase/D-cysteine desulfhydrase [Streptomyces marincola]|uniref:1-aminocyclopropane-1-carboxylate deaminase/D-cysteine desulfhydrase n=1 Tax=Streptomyces marincola TaxID=2878388 RepID=UPI001CF0ED96|nr:pyridoxal-phosphate dependent enzyme [Streptomyces marincola]UCM88416.1 pyridoxal-phosphate dependent enzyme [Streptomyces marincola]
MVLPAALPSPLVTLTDPDLADSGIELRLKRDDLIAPGGISGNKWRKLVPNLRAALDEGHTRLLTFGGAWSHHIHAVAAAAAACGLASVGVIRGDELADAPRNWSLAEAERNGMELAFVDRRTYRETLAHLDDPATRRRIERRWGRCYVLPEGGSNALAARGTAGLVEELPGLGPRDLVCCPVGTGGTLAGIAAALPAGARAWGVAVLKGGAGYLEDEVTRLHRSGWARTFPNWHISHTHHGGGYARLPAALTAFASAFEERHGLAVEPRYVAKMLHCVYDTAPALPRGTRVTAVITGPPHAPAAEAAEAAETPDPGPGRAR